MLVQRKESILAEGYLSLEIGECFITRAGICTTKIVRVRPFPTYHCSNLKLKLRI